MSDNIQQLVEWPGPISIGQFQDYTTVGLEFYCSSRRRAGFVFHTNDHTHPPGTQLLLWADVDLPAESLQEVKSLPPSRRSAIIMDEFATFP